MSNNEKKFLSMRVSSCEHNAQLYTAICDVRDIPSVLPMLEDAEVIDKISEARAQLSAESSDADILVCCAAASYSKYSGEILLTLLSNEAHGIVRGAVGEISDCVKLEIMVMGEGQ